MTTEDTQAESGVEPAEAGGGPTITRRAVLGAAAAGAGVLAAGATGIGRAAALTAPHVAGARDARRGAGSTTSSW